MKKKQNKFFSVITEMQNTYHQLLDDQHFSRSFLFHIYIYIYIYESS